MRYDLMISNVSPTWGGLTAEQIKERDFKNVLNGGEPEITKGVEVFKPYFLNDKLCVKEFFSDILAQSGQLKGIRTTVKFYKKDGGIVGFEYIKDDVFGEKLGYEFTQKRRKLIISDMESRAKKYNALEHLEDLFSFFRTEIDSFVEYGSTAFYDKVMLVKDSNLPEHLTVKTVLNRSFDSVEMVWETIVYEIT